MKGRLRRTEGKQKDRALGEWCVVVCKPERGRQEHLVSGPAKKPTDAVEPSIFRGALGDRQAGHWDVRKPLAAARQDLAPEQRRTE